MIRNILLIINFFFAFFVNAQVSKTVNVSTAGTLRTLFTITEMTSVTNLTVTGIIDAQDFKFMRDGITKLTVLNISGVTIQAYNGSGGTSTINSYPTNEMPAQAFYYRKSLTNVSIPNSVTSIGENVFCNCSGLKSIIIPNSVTSIGIMAFSYCSGLTNITIPNSVITIGDWTFGFCSGLTSITIGNSVTSIGNYAFHGCSLYLTSITIPNSVTAIGDWAFGYCSGLKSITIPNSVTSIGDQAFRGCSGLTSITIGNSVRSIGYGAFEDCSNIVSIYVYATTPIVLSSGVFYSVNNYVSTLYVPVGSIAAYQAASQWGDFYNIVEMAPTALPTLALVSVNIYPNPVTDGFYVNELEGTGMLILTNLSGNVFITKQVKTNDYVSVGNLPKGVYIVKIATAKGIIKRKVIKE